MTARTLYIPARFQSAAEKVAYAIDDGRIACCVEYLTPAEAGRRAAAINLTDEGHQVYEVESVATHDGRIRIARLFSAIGDMAAAMLIVIGGSFLVAWGSLL